MNKISRWIDWPYVIGLLLLPFLIMGGILSAGFLQGLFRYNQDYFKPHYQDLYAAPNKLITDLETALREGDESLLAETQGTSKAEIKAGANPNLRFMIMIESSGKYLDYLFMDTSNYKRYPQHLKQLKALHHLWLYTDYGIPNRAVRELKNSLPRLRSFELETK